MRVERAVGADRKVAGHGFGGEKSFYCELFIGWDPAQLPDGKRSIFILICLLAAMTQAQSWAWIWELEGDENYSKNCKFSHGKPNL